MSGTMVFYNKFLLSYFGFMYPITVSPETHVRSARSDRPLRCMQLTMWHMIACSAIASALIFTRLVQPLAIPSDLYYKKVVPIAACYAGALWTSNAAYSICSVSFAQVRCIKKILII